MVGFVVEDDVGDRLDIAVVDVAVAVRDGVGDGVVMGVDGYEK